MGKQNKKAKKHVETLKRIRDMMMAPKKKPNQRLGTQYLTTMSNTRPQQHQGGKSKKKFVGERHSVNYNTLTSIPQSHKVYPSGSINRAVERRHYPFKASASPSADPLYRRKARIEQTPNFRTDERFAGMIIPDIVRTRGGETSDERTECQRVYPIVNAPTRPEMETPLQRHWRTKNKPPEWPGYHVQGAGAPIQTNPLPRMLTKSLLAKPYPSRTAAFTVGMSRKEEKEEESDESEKPKSRKRKRS